MTKISPKKIIEISEKLYREIYKQFVSYKKVEAYISHYQENYYDDYGNHCGCKFDIVYRDNNKDIDLETTLHKISLADQHLLFQIAYDLGVEVPSVVYGVPEIINITAEKYTDVHSIFEKAYKNIYKDPDGAVFTANSALETIIKRILENINLDYDKKDTLYKLSEAILKYFKMHPSQKDELAMQEIWQIGSGLLNASKHIETLRSDKTYAHGKIREDYVIHDPLYAQFVINAVSTIGLFLLNFYEKKYIPQNIEVEDDECPF